MSAERRTDNSDAASAGKPSGLRRVAGFVPTFLRAHVIALSIIVVLYTLAGFFLVPRIARSNIESYVTQMLHRKISLGEIRFNP